MTIDYIEKITLQEELKNIKEQLKTVQDENAKLKTDIDLHCKANAEKTEKIKRLSEELDALKYTNLILRTNAATRAYDARIETLENDRSELMSIHIADVETINKLNIQARDLNNTISTLLDRVSKSDKENQKLKKKVQDLNDFIQNMCQSHNVKVSIEYDYDWAEWVITVSSRNTTKAINHTYRYKNIDIEASGIGAYEYLRQRIVLEIAKNF